MERNGKKKNTKPDDLGKLLYNFIEIGNVEEAKLLVTVLECDVNWVYNYGWTPLILASSRDYPDVVKVLLARQDLLINSQTQYGDSALIRASMSGNTRCVELLVDDPRINVHSTEGSDYSALSWAYVKSYIPIVKLLISHGSNVKEVIKSYELEMWLSGSKPPTAEVTEVMENWKSYLPEFTRFAKTNNCYPTEFKDWAFNFILCCLKSRSFPKDIIHLLLEYIARAWKRI